MLGEIRDWAGGLVRAEAQPPLWLSFPTAPSDSPEGRLVPGGDYFRVRVHRIHLTYERQWFQKFSPVLLVATTFSYDGTEVTQPAVIGPAMIEQLGSAAPITPVIAGSVVTGPHPLREPNLSVTVALQRVVRSDSAGALLDVVEGAAKTLDLLAGLTPYTALARVVVSGLNVLSGGDKPIMARRDEFSPVVASYHALVSPMPGLDTRSLIVVDNELMNSEGGRLTPFRSTDYVLYSVDRVPMEDVDVTRLPLHRQWLTVLGEATQASTPQVWDSAKTNLSSLVTMAFTSPDLTYQHAEALEQEWIAKAISRRQSALRRGDMGGPAQVLGKVRSRALAVMDL